MRFLKNVLCLSCFKNIVCADYSQRNNNRWSPFYHFIDVFFLIPLYICPFIVVVVVEGFLFVFDVLNFAKFMLSDGSTSSSLFRPNLQLNDVYR
mmetsp:Transcript_5649/g.11798  ORF Transcript_5649/g.11798 Transcript_5649/m.11798 type:complete len:94 (-) Transcript_5649:359-640(-)